MSVLESLLLGLLAGALMLYAWAEPRMADLEQTIADLLEELEDTTAERDAFRWHLDDVIDCSLGETALDRARRMHPAGGRHGDWTDRPALHIVGRA